MGTKFLTSGWRRYALAFVVVGVSFGVMGAQCQPTKPPPPAGLSISPTIKDFGDDTADGGSGNFQIFTVTNNGPATTTLAVSLQGGDPSQFELVRPSAPGVCVYFTKLDPGESCPQQVFFNPRTTGRATTTLVVTGNPGGTATAALFGNGIP